MGSYLAGLVTALQPVNFLVTLAGVIGGIIIGALPGLTATMGVALLVPFTFSMGATQGLAMLLGLYVGAIYGGSISAILIRTPGTPAAAATVLDGYPMAQKGQAGKAIGMSTIASFSGGMFSALVLTFLTPQLSKVALKFGPSEYFALAVFGLSIIISVSGRSIVKGLISGAIGLVVAFVGLDPMSGFPRFTFGNVELLGGISFIPVLIGLFALSEVFRGVEGIATQSEIAGKLRRVIPEWTEIKKVLVTILRSSVIGTFIGILPGAGADIAAFVGYSEAKRNSKHPEKFGTGILEGIAAPESANNAVTGGAMIPMLSLGIPGDAVTAVMLGALTIQGLQPGPLLFKDHAEIVYAVFAGLMLANILMITVGLTGARLFARVITVDKRVLVPAIAVLSFVGSFAIRNSVFDVGVALVFGVIGYLMQIFKYPASPTVLALILGPMAESSLRRALVISHGSFAFLINRPLTLGLLGIAIASLISSVLRHRAALRREMAA